MFAFEEEELEPGRISPCYNMNTWIDKLGDIKVYEQDLHHLILNFLTVNGFAETVEAFCREAKVQPPMAVSCISRRIQIGVLIRSGRIEEALSEIKQISPDVLRNDVEVSFLLQRQQLLQIIQSGDAGKAIEFAQQCLAPSVKDCPHLLPQLEDAMALLAFSDLSCTEAQRLIAMSEQRELAAKRVDEALLDLFNLQQESALELLIKNVLFSQASLQKSKVRFPVVLDLKKATLGEQAANSTRAREPQEAVDVLRQQQQRQQQQDELESATGRQRQQNAATATPSAAAAASSPGGGLLTGAPRRAQEREPSRDLGRRRRPGGNPP